MSRDLINSGKDLGVFLWELIKFQRDMALLYIDEKMIEYSDDEKAQMLELAKDAREQDFLELISKLSDAQTKIKWASEQEILFEALLIKIGMERSGPVIIQANTFEVINNANANVQQNLLLNTNNSVEELNKDLTDKVLTTLKENGKMRIQADLLTTKIQLQEDGIVHIIFNGNILPMTKANFQKEETKIAIKSAVQKALGKEVSVKYDNFK